MNRPKLLYPTERRIYHPELTRCPHCGMPTQLLNYLAWDKTVQTLTGPLSLASRPSQCPDPACPGAALRLRSLAARHRALPGLTYGLDVVAHLGRLRQEQRLTFAQTQAALPPPVQISVSQVRTLYHEAYLPLLAVSARTHHDALTHLAQQQGGLLLALDGLAPEGGEPQLWGVYEVLTGLPVRVGWVSQFDQATFETFLQPLAAAWPIRAVLSDKQQGLEAAIATVFPTAAHQLCQAHYLCRLADPLQTADMQLAKTVRAAVRTGVGPALRAETPGGGAPNGLLTVTGILPEPLPPAPAPPAPAAAPTLVSELRRRVRYLLTLKTHPPDHWAGLDLVAGLEAILAFSERLLAHRADAGLTALVQTLTDVLAGVREQVARVRQGVGWLTDIRALLDPTQTLALSGAGVAADLSAYLERMDLAAAGDSFLEQVVGHMWGVSRRYWRGLFPTYDQDGLPRTNNGMESRFREVRRRLLRTTGQAGQTAAQLQRVGAWELLAGAASEAEQVAAFTAVDRADWKQERTRVRQHQARFRLHQRNPRRAGQQLERLAQQWLALPADSTG